MDQAKVSAVTSWPCPEIWKQLQHFLGFANIYHHFVRNYSCVAAPTSTNVTFQWTSIAEQSFDVLKLKFTSTSRCLILSVTSWQKWILQMYGWGLSFPTTPRSTANSTPVSSSCSLPSRRNYDILLSTIGSCWQCRWHWRSGANG